MEPIHTDPHREHLLKTIFDYAAKVAGEREFNRLLDLIADMGKELIRCDRCTIWLLDRARNELWSKVAHGLGSVRIPAQTGIVGAAVTGGEPIIINDPYCDLRFNDSIDKKTGYTTRSILTIPMLGLDGQVMGAFQAVNKESGEGFGEEDTRHLMLAASFGAKILDAEHLVAMNDYHTAEQMRAFKKQASAIINDLEEDPSYKIRTHYQPSDILSGDFYSIHRTKNGGVLCYVLDAMGHGVMPSLTSFGVATAVKQHLAHAETLEELAAPLATTFQKILAEAEQLSCFFLWIRPEKDEAHYFSGGMYPAYLEDAEGVKPLPANNFPFMNFTDAIKVEPIPCNGFIRLLAMTDGLIEEAELLEEHKGDMEHLLDHDRLDRFLEKTEGMRLGDDVTVVYLEKL